MFISMYLERERREDTPGDLVKTGADSGALCGPSVGVFHRFPVGAGTSGRRDYAQKNCASVVIRVPSWTIT